MTRRSTVPVRNAAQERSRRPARSALAAATALLVAAGTLSLTPRAASADKIADKRREAARIASQIQRNYDRLSLLDEQINDATVRSAQLSKQIRTLRHDDAVARTKIHGLEGGIAERAASLYRNAGATDSLSPTQGSIQQQGAQAVYEQATASRDLALIDQFQRARTALASAQRKLTKAQQDLDAQTASIKKSRSSLLATNKQQQALLARTKGELATLVAQEQARQAAKAAADARRRAEEQAARDAAAAAGRGGGGGRNIGGGGGGVGDSGGSVDPGPIEVVATNPNAQTAVNRAMAQVGKWYSFGSAGPDTFDCSGLTSYAWAAAGVYLPHSSGGQYSSLPHVSQSALEPGDLVFFGHPIHHVGMYIGGGMMVEAPHTGARVRTATIYRRDYVGAARP